MHLRLNAAKSALARPWERTFLGYSGTAHRETRLRIAPQSVHRLTKRVRALLRAGRGRSLSHTIETLNPLLRGWLGYFQLTDGKRTLEEIDGWLRRRLRLCVAGGLLHAHAPLFARRSLGSAAAVLGVRPGGVRVSGPDAENFCLPHASAVNMRHVKLQPAQAIDAACLEELVHASYGESSQD